MADRHLSKRRGPVELFIVLFGTLLAFVGYSWYNRGADLLPNSIVVQRADVLDFQDKSSQRSNLTLERRQSYQCSSSNPCSNGACCGGSGYCGYGPTYCGQGCVSHCDAVAECGQFAKVAGTECPLKTCCSQYGFCGTTSDFCEKDCQSNCVLNPAPPGGGADKSILSNRVIGYYESWSARLDCHKVQPTDLPLDALTHINFAFAYINPGSYEIVTMDGSTPSSLFTDITNVKSVKQDLSVFVSVGGWTFSDNGTATQPLYGEIAADAGKRQTFANNVVKFMRQYGFDGLDIDWEYPGAPDRGGKPDDTQNYVLLMQTLRSTFDASGGKYGLTFTTPSSYWYLRWFDLPNMMKYADWTNLMTYDLHGVWDSTDPIGSIVQGHTNLTEIKLAAELFWRVGIPPASIVMGFGFYGRSFTLADPSCATPGCAFSGASNPGPCTATGGILGYYEIQAILSQNPSITPVHDTTNAVMYFTFDKNQWISFDNKDTFQQKVDWANGVGLGGAMIWASDLDDDKYSAHAALLGRNVISTSALQITDKALSNPQAVISSLASDNGQNCFAYKGKCVHIDDTKAMQAACGAGNTVVGWDDAGCGSKKCHCGKPICCPTNAAPKGCSWRGDDNGSGAASDCSAQCAPGEINIKGIGSSWGGGFKNDGNTNKCGRGFKVFCCPDPSFLQLTQGCGYTKCRGSCPSSQTALFTGGSCWFGVQTYCCPKPTGLTDCHWVTKTKSKGVDSDCANAVCSATEVEVLRSYLGDDEHVRCAFKRQQAACCSVKIAPVTPAMCSYNLCRDSGFCTNDGTPGIAANKRDLPSLESGSTQSVHLLEKRGQDHYVARLPGLIEFVIIAIAVDAINSLYGGRNAGQVLRTQFRLRPGACIGPAIDLIPIPAGSNPPGLNGDQTEHPLEPQFSVTFFEAATRGLLSGNRQPPINLAPLNPNYINNFWNHPLHNLGQYPAIGGQHGATPYTANDRMMGAFGSVDWPEPLMAVDQQINGPKGRMFKFNPPTSEDNLEALAEHAIATDQQADADNLLSHIRSAFAIFEYMNTQQFITRWNLARNQVRRQLGYIQTEFAANGWPIPTATQWWDVILDDHLRRMEEYMINWMDDAIDDAFAAYLQANNRLPNGQTLTTWPSVQNTLDQWRQIINDGGQELRFSQALYAAYIPLPQPPGNGGGGGGGGSP